MVFSHRIVALVAVLAAATSVLGRAAEADRPTTPVHVVTRRLDTDEPVSGVQVRVRFNSQTLIADSDDQGIARFAVPDGASLDRVEFRTSKIGLAPMAMNWSKGEESPTLPSIISLHQEAVGSLGGRVLDQHDQPLTNATVVVTVRKDYPNPGQWINFSYESTKTAADGRWSFVGLPDGPKSVDVAAYHYECLGESAAFFFSEFRPVAALRNQTAVIRLDRGTRVEGVVRGPGGMLVADAEVFYDSGRRFSNTIPALKTDAEGRFVVGIKPGLANTLTARKSGFGPVVQEIRVGEEPLSVTLQLPVAHKLTGRVVGPEGAPVAKASVSAFWRGNDTSSSRIKGRETIYHSMKADDRGVFSWSDAPAAGIQLEAWAEGLVSKATQPLAADQEHTIVLSRPTPVQAMVVDAQTGQPLPNYTVSVGAIWEEGDRLIWQGKGWARKLERETGRFHCQADWSAHAFVIRVSADDYLPEDSAAILIDGKPRNLEFRLTRAPRIEGHVTRGDGSSVSDGVVYLMPIDDQFLLVNGDVPENDKESAIKSIVGDDGAFVLPPQRDEYYLVAICEEGLAVVHRRDYQAAEGLRLQPWARVSGVIEGDDKPSSPLRLVSRADDRPAPDKARSIENRLSLDTDELGRFELPRVSPGRLNLGHWVSNGVPDRIWFNKLATLDVAAGGIYDLKIGSGRKVVGRLAFDTSVVWMIRKAEVVPQAEPLSTTYGVRVLSDGRFRVHDLPPGDYKLKVAIHGPPESDACGWGQLLGDFAQSFRVPMDRQETDLGTLQPVKLAEPKLAIGDVAPDFTVTTFAGETVRLSDMRGKFVLLDFWATWCAPCIAEIPNLRKIYESHRTDERFVIVSLSLDDVADDVQRYLDQIKLPWPQAFVGQEARVVSDYGATSIPATFLIGPDGRIVARNIRGHEGQDAVSAALSTKQ